MRGSVRAMRQTSFVLLALLLVTPVGAEEPARPKVEYRDDRVTAKLEAVELEAALAALAQASGAELRGTVRTPRTITTELDAVPIGEAMPRLLGEQNFTLSYAADGRLTAIVLLGGPEKPPPPAAQPAASPAAGSSKPPAFPLELSRTIREHRPVPVPQPLARRMKADQAKFPELLEVATVDANGVNRAMATQVVLSALEKESRLRRSFFRTLRQLDEPTAATIMASSSGPRFKEMMEYLAAHSREPGLQKKAAAVVEQLSPPAAAPGS